MIGHRNETNSSKEFLMTMKSHKEETNKKKESRDFNATEIYFKHFNQIEAIRMNINLASIVEKQRKKENSV